MRGKLSFLRIKERPFELLGLFAFLFFLISFIPFDQKLDVNLHDTYFVFSIQSIFIICTVYLLFIWAVYLATNKFLLSVKLIWIHVIVTILPIITLIIISAINPSPGYTSKRYYSIDGSENTNPFFIYYYIYATSAILLLAGQFLLPINIAGGLLKKMLR
ncbi:MAG: hypothetical protein V4456_03710 [Bacteroidota bacterium]